MIMKSIQANILSRLKLFVFISFLLIQGFLLLILFQRSIEIKGDILNYLEFISGNPSDQTFNFEPISIAIFKFIGLFPETWHFNILYFVSFLSICTSNLLIFKKTNKSLFWIVFYSICVMPFANAINIRTGYGLTFLLYFVSRKNAFYWAPFFHVSLSTLLLGMKFKIKFKSVIVLCFITGLLFYFLKDLIINKLSSYLLYYIQGESVFGIIFEIFLLFSFSLLFFKKYRPTNGYIWLRVLIFLFLLATIFSPIAIISSRFISLIYFALILMRVSSTHYDKIISKSSAIRNLLFGVFFLGLIFIRFYRVATMFGYWEVN
jgi:hypothetical protein